MSVILPDLLALAFPIGLGILSSKLPKDNDYVEPPQEHEIPIYTEPIPETTQEITTETTPDFLQDTSSEVMPETITETQQEEIIPETESLEGSFDNLIENTQEQGNEEIETTENINVISQPYTPEDTSEKLTNNITVGQSGGYLMESSFIVEMGLSVVPWSLFALTPSAGESTTESTNGEII